MSQVFTRMKPDVYNKDIEIHFIGKKIPNDFVVGYGMDFNENGRNLLIFIN